MWLLRYLFFSIVLGMFAIVVLLFLGQNQRIERLSFFGLEYTTNLVWVLLGAGALGVLLTLLLLLPGRIGVALHNRSLERDLRYLEHELLRLQEQRERMLARHELLLDTHERVLQSYQRLVAEHGRVTAERDRVRTQLAATGTSRVPTAGRVRASTPRLAIVSPPVPARPADSVAKPSVGRVSDITAAPAQITASTSVHDVAPAPTADREGINDAERDDSQRILGVPTAVAPVPTPVAAAVRSVEAASASEKPAVVIALATVTTEPAIPAEPIRAASSQPLPVAGTPADRPTLPTLPTRIVTNIIIPFAQEVATLPDQLRDRMREDIADLSALVVNVRAALETKLARIERTGPPSIPSKGVAGGDDRN